MKKRSYIRMAHQQKMLSRKAILAGLSIMAVAVVAVIVSNFSHSQSSMASTAKKTTITAAASEGTGVAMAKMETISKAMTTTTTIAAQATMARTDSRAAAMGMADEEQAMNIIARQLAEDILGKTSMVFMESASGIVNLSTPYTYPGRPDMSKDELEDLRKSNKPGANTAEVASAHLTASIDAAPDVSASDNSLRKFEVVSPENAVNFESVKLKKFDIQHKYNNIFLAWSTDGEHYSDYFAIEKSTDGKTYTEIGKVNGGGDYKNDLLYTFIDRKPSEGAAWYRLHQYDFSGNEKIYPAKKIK